MWYIDLGQGVHISIPVCALNYEFFHLVILWGTCHVSSL